MTISTNTLRTPGLRFPEFEDEPAWPLLPGNVLFEPINERKSDPGLPVLAITQEHGAIPRHLIDYHVSVTAESVATYKEVREGDFIISLRSFQGGIEFSRYHGICSPAYIILRRKTAGCDDFFRHLFKSERFIRQLTRNIEGVRDGKMISFAQFSRLRIPSPGVEEQQRVADCLSSLEDLLTAERTRLKALQRHKSGLMDGLFARPDEAFPALRFPAFEAGPGWVTGQCRDIAQIISGYGFPDKHQGSQAGEYPFYKVSDISRAISTGSRFISEARNYIGDDVLKAIRAKLAPPGTIIFAKIGEAIRSNRRVVTTRPAVIDNNTAGVKALDGVVLDAFLFYLWSNVELMKHAGGVVPAVTKSTLEAVPVCYPADLAEQQLIVDCLSELDLLLSAQMSRISALEAHRDGLLQRLFPDAADEL